MKIRICDPPKQASTGKDDIEDTGVFVPLVVTPKVEGDYNDRMRLFFRALENEQKEKCFFKKVALVIGALLGGLVLCNVGMMWSV